MEEIEVKILEINETETRNRLEGFAVLKSQDVLLKTIYYGNPYNDASVRVRVMGDSSVFTVKVDIPDTQFKVKKEYETEIGEWDTFNKQLEILGYRQAGVQEKRRTTYEYKDSEILIDCYPGIPPYLEIEGPREEIKEVVERLGFSMANTTDMNVYDVFRRYRVDERMLKF